MSFSHILYLNKFLILPSIKFKPLVYPYSVLSENKTWNPTHTPRIGFLFSTLENCYESLKKNGYLLLNIANTSSGKNIENAALDISKGFGLIHEKTLQLTLSSVMGAGYKYEPIFVFKKVGD